MSNRAKRLSCVLITALLGLTIIFLCYNIDTLQRDLTEAQNKPPVYITEYVEIEKIIEKSIYIEVPIKEEVIKWENIPYHNWVSVDEFREWYEAQEFKVLFPSGTYLVDCDDYAVRLQRRALEQGYPVSQALILRGKYFGVEVTEGKSGHAGNLVLIDGVYYYVEPHPDRFDITWICERD